MLTPGSEVAGFRIERLLGRGGMGEVYAARQITLDRLVALKILRPGLGLDEQFRERFRREGVRQATLDHPHIVTVYEAGDFEGGLFLAMRLVEGVTLKELISVGAVDPRRALRLLVPVAAALDAAHALGLVHRDVKPQNILIRDDDHPYVADFGLTRYIQDTALTRTGQIVGTIDYIAPEILRGEQAGAAVDVYALAAVLHECLTGAVPYPRESEPAVLYAHVHAPPPAPSTVRPDLPGAIDAVLAAGMAKAPQDRPASASALMALATEALGDAAPEILTRVRVPSDPVARGLRPAKGVADAETMPAETETATAATARVDAPPPTGRSRQRFVPVVGAVVALAVAGVAYATSDRGGSAPSPTIVTTSSTTAAATGPYTHAEFRDVVRRVCDESLPLRGASGSRFAYLDTRLERLVEDLAPHAARAPVDLRAEFGRALKGFTRQAATARQLATVSDATQRRKALNSLAGDGAVTNRIFAHIGLPTHGSSSQRCVPKEQATG